MKTANITVTVRDGTSASSEPPSSTGGIDDGGNVVVTVEVPESTLPGG